MRLTNLIKANDAGLRAEGNPDVEIAGLAADSREVEAGFLFAALPGAQHDGSAFIAEAIKKGAAAILMPEDHKADIRHLASICFITACDIRSALPLIASRFYPRQPGIVAAVTGTSGKTSTVQFAREAWQALGHKSASLGSFGFITPEGQRYSAVNTPLPITLHRQLQEAADQGISRLAMEASSHGLALHRMDHVRLKTAGFTNLSRDHLDFHQTMEDYFAAKQRLFAELLPEGGAAVINADVPEFTALARIAETRRHKIISYGLKGKEIRLAAVTPDAKGQILRIELFGKAHETLLPVIGQFQAWNALCALGLVIACGDDPARAVEALGKVTGVAGRLQRVGATANGASVFVDYAHKPDALENVLKALRPHVAAQNARLGVVFGCGGDRDKGKRPIMGEIAGRLADWVIVTDDNPRHEEPGPIRRAILDGCIGADVKEIADRAEAIEAGIGRLGKGDVLIIAGKGHETGQIVGDKVLPFDDAEVARKVLGS
ncbi:MAG TPA: UDP-N-acetylmuramoyl-L-alanyl-D-glutamate--2,6-diaminopimelate ligase [Alphaproteobacteria bacterium]|nr:UDP-N-acetylmuramoyl-L-alanyl-D-glutamate--2,6-diaminopimelate ligase [Alphaproteobacteria bacterium]